MGDWATISGTGSGTFTPPPAAPNILDDGTTVASVYWEAYGHDWKWGFQGTLHLPTGDAAYAHLEEIDIIAVEAGGKTIALPPLYAAFSGSTITFKTDPQPIAIPYASQSWVLSFRCINDANKATASPTQRTVAVTPPTVSSVTVVETGPRIVTNVGRALATSLTVTPTLSVNLGGGGGIQTVTIWTSYAWADPDKGPDPIVTNKGWYDVTGTSTALLLTGVNQVFVTGLSSTVLTVRVAIGAIEGIDIPASAATGTYTMSGPASPTAGGSWINTANFTGLSSQLKYFSIGGGAYVFKFGTLGCVIEYSLHPSLKSERSYVQNGKLTGTTWVADPNDPLDKPFCDAQITATDNNTVITVTGDAVTISPVWPWSVRPSTYLYPDVRIHLDGISTAGAIVIQAAFAGQTSPCSEIVFSSDGRYCYIQPSLTKAIATAVPWDPLFLGDRLGATGGVLNVSTPGAPAPTLVTAVVNSSSASPPTLSPILGLPVWNAVLTVTLATANVNYPHTKAIVVQVPGYSDFSITSWTPDGSHQISITLPTEYQDSSSHGLTVSVLAINEDGTPSAAATVGITVPGASAPFDGAAPLAPVIVTAVATVNYVPFGDWWQFYFSGSFTGPTDLLAATKFVRVSKISPAGNRGPVCPDIQAPPGGFVAGTVYTFAGFPYDDLPQTGGNWTVEFLPVNADNVPAAVLNKVVAVTPPAVTVVVAAEAASSRVADFQGGLTCTINTTPTLTNNPGGSGGIQTCTIWFIYDSGGGLGVQTIGQGTFPVTGPGGSIIAIPGIPLTTLASTTFTVKMIAGPSIAATPPAGAASGSFTMAGIATPANNWVTGATIDQVGYGQLNWAFKTLAFTALFSTHAELNAVRVTVQEGSYVSSVFTPNPARPAERPFCDIDRTTGAAPSGTAVVTLTGDAVTIQLVDPWSIPTGFDTFKIRIYAISRLGSGTQTLQNSFAGTPPPGVTYLGTSCDIKPNASLAPINWTNLGAAPAAPAVLAATANLVSTSASTFPAVGGLPAWQVSGLITLDVANVNFARTKQLRVVIPGVPTLFIPSPSTLIGGNQVSYTVAYEYQDTVAHNYTITYGAENEQAAVNFGLVTQSINVPGTPAPIGSAGPAPAITTASATTYFQRFGHEFSVGFIPAFTAPANPNGGTYSVRVSKISPSGGRATIDTLPGPFTPASPYGFTGEAVDLVQATSQTWVIEFLAINADGVATLPPTTRNITVAPNVISFVTGIEGTRFIEGGDGGKSHVNLTPTITTANAPGMSAAAPQTITCYFSADGGVTWFGLAWVDLASSGILQAFEVWRPTASSKTCKVAAVIGAFNWAEGTFTEANPTGPIPNASLPTGTVQSATFPLAQIGAPQANDITGGFVNPRTATGAALYNGVTLMVNGDGVAYAGLPDGIGFVIPPRAFDPNFFYASLTVQAVDSSGNPAPAEQQGLEREVGQYDTVGTNTERPIWWTFNPVGSVYTRWRFRVRVVSRSASNGFKDASFSTLQTSAWTGSPPTGVTYGGSFCDVLFGAAPPTSIIAQISPTQVGAGLEMVGGVIKAKIAGAPSNILVNPGAESGLTGWTIPGSGTTADSNSPHSGSFQIRMAANASAYAQQNGVASAGQSITATLWARSTSATGNLWCFLRFFDGANGTGTLLSQPNRFIAPNGVYTQIDIGFGTIIAPSGTQSFTYGFQGQQTAGVWDVDDCSLVIASGAGGGIGFDASSALKINPSTTVGVDGSNNMAVLNASLGLAQFGGVYQPYAFYAGLPFIDSTTPKIIINTAVSPWKVYRQNGFGGWTKDVDPQDIVAGTITALVQIISPTISGGSISGATLALNLNGVQTIIANTFDAGASANVGLRILETAVGWYTTVRAQGLNVIDPAGFGSASLLQFILAGSVRYGRLQVARSDNLCQITLGSNDGTIRVNSSGGVQAGVTLTDGTNTMQITASGIFRNGVGLIFP